MARPCPDPWQVVRSADGGPRTPALGLPTVVARQASPAPQKHDGGRSGGTSTRRCAMPHPDEPPCRLSLVLTSEGSPERAEALAQELVERGLVACASLLPVRSHYRWQGKLECSDEVKLLLKTSPDRLPALRRAIDELHSYETPEWISWEATSNGAYGQWLVEQLSPGDGPPARPGSPGDGAPAG